MALRDVIFLAVVGIIVVVVVYFKSRTSSPAYIEIETNLKIDPAVYIGVGIDEGVAVPFVNYLVNRCLNVHRSYSLKELISNTRYLEFLNEVKGVIEYRNLPIEQLYASEPRTKDKPIDEILKQGRLKALANFFGFKRGYILTDLQVKYLTGIGRSIVRVMMKSLRKRVNEYRLTNKHFI